MERGRRVDARIREILQWGIPEPGGVGGGKGLPASFLENALLPAQAEVSALLERSLQDDPTGSGKESIAAALQAVGQDPQFVALLREIQARRDSAYTDKGARKTAKGSVFKTAADRVNQSREQVERLQRIVSDSEGAEIRLRDLTTRRSQAQEALAVAKERAATVELLARQAKDLAAAAELVRVAQDEVVRIRGIGMEVDAQEREVADSVHKRIEAELALKDAQVQHAQAQAALEAAEAEARAGASDPALSDTVARQQLELRRASAEQVAKEAQTRIDAALAVRKLVDAVVVAERVFQEQQAKLDAARQATALAVAKEKAAAEELLRCDLIERALEVLAADKQVAEAQASVQREAGLRERLEAASAERTRLVEQRAAIIIPLQGALAPMRRLATELATARGALDVGLVVTVTPKFRLDVAVRKDGREADSTSTTEPVEIEAGAEIEVAITGIATVRVRGGRREAQQQARALENRWKDEVLPHLTAAGVRDLDGLSAKVAEAQELDAAIRLKDAEIESVRGQIAPLAGVAEALREAETRRTALGKVRLETLAADLKVLGSDPAAGLRKRRQKASKDRDAVRAIASQASNAQTLAEERSANSRLALDAAILAQDASLATFPEGLDTALADARATLANSIVEKDRVAAAVAALESTIEARRKRIDAALGDARASVDKSRLAVESAQKELTGAVSGHAAQEARLIEFRKRADAENLAAAETRFHEAADSHALLPVPARNVTDGDVAAAQSTAVVREAELEAIEFDIREAHGALKQVGGAVARERLRDATEAFELAEREERETELEYEAWKLLLEQMKEADAAQASNLGRALAPAIAGRFHALTQRRYETVQLTAQLGTEGVVIGGALRPTARVSVGTREQLSTLYRLALAEYLRTAVVLDDQLVQSDIDRMGWFRELLTEKARSFQIIVFTCRPGDYLVKAMVPAGERIHADSEEGFIRAVDLNRAIRRC